MSRLSRMSMAVALAAAAIGYAAPARALASATQTTSMMDDDQLIYVSQARMARTLQTMAWLGTDIVKVSLVWQLVAPAADSSHRPRFDATDPSAYPAGAWDRYDALVKTAGQLGMRVYFIVIGPAPKWAVPSAFRNTRQGPALGHPPNPRDYQNFLEAAGRRYSGAWPDPSAPGSDSSSTPPVGVKGVTVPTVTASQGAPTPPGTIPRVDYWGIWNEPNERSWLNPWYREVSGHKVLIQPELYRGLVDAAWNGLSASSHTSDTFLIGETANRGILTPSQFVRELYCVGTNLRPLRGSAASDVGCPSSGSPSGFANHHPGLFESAGWAHHPYAFDVPPSRPYPDRTYVTIQNLPSFERLLNGIYATYGLHPSGGVPLYLTEWGEKSNPPNPYVRTTTAEQAAWINEGEYLTWRMPYVRSLNQFLLVDSPPKAHTRKGSQLYWSTFQTGLETIRGAAKPALQAYNLPIWLPSSRHGANVAIWGQLRPANHTDTQTGEIEFRRSASARWSQLTSVETSSPEGFIYTHVNIPSAGQLRLAWPNPAGSVIYSRTVTVS